MIEVEAMDRIKYVRMIAGRYAYFRTPETGDIRLRGEPGTAEFFKHYGELLMVVEGRRSSPADDQVSLAWLVESYLRSAEFAALADSTQLDYARTCALIKAELGPEPYRFITRAMVKAVRDDFAGQPRKAHKIRQMVSCLYAWADGADLVPEGCNPAGGLKRLRRKGGNRHYVPWSDQEIDWSIAAAEPHELTPLLIFLYTGQRRGDVCAMTWRQWQGDLIRVRTSKTHQLVDLPCHPVLKAHLEQLRSQAKVVSLNGAICLSKDGQPFSPNALSGVIRRLTERVPQIAGERSPHGLRYAAAARMDAGGATPMLIAEVLGQQTYKMACQYASARMRAEQGIAAMRGAD